MTLQTPRMHVLSRRGALTLAVAAGFTMTTSVVSWAAPLAAPPAAPPTSAPAASDARTFSGSLPDGATWTAQVPAAWNGTLLLYSHGYLPSFAGAPNTAQDAPDPTTEAALLAEGYALTGSSYAAAGWAMNTAVADQLDTLAATTSAMGRPRRVLAVGTSMGGLVTAKLAETAGRRIQGALATCGIVGGGVALSNYQLDGAYTIAQLLAPTQQIPLVRFTGLDQAFATASALVAAVQQAQTTAEGRARVALAAALFQDPSWRPGEPPPTDADSVEHGQYEWLLKTLQFTVPARFDIETAEGGNPSWNAGADYRDLLSQSVDAPTVRTLYREAGLNLDADLAVLTAGAATTADPAAVARMEATSVPSGRVQMPVLSLHTIADPLVPVQHENAYRLAVTSAGRGALLRQAFVARTDHCTFTPAELVAAVHALDHRVATGSWQDATTQRLQQAATSLGLGDAAFVPFIPPRLLREDRHRVAGAGPAPGSQPATATTGT